MTAPLPVCSAKLSMIWLCQYYGGGPRWNPKVFFFLFCKVEYLTSYNPAEDYDGDVCQNPDCSSFVNFWNFAARIMGVSISSLCPRTFLLVCFLLYSLCALVNYYNFSCLHHGLLISSMFSILLLTLRIVFDRCISTTRRSDSTPHPDHQTSANCPGEHHSYHQSSSATKVSWCSSSIRVFDLPGSLTANGVAVCDDQKDRIVAAEQPILHSRGASRRKWRLR